MEGLERIKERIVQEAQDKKNKILEDTRARNEKMMSDCDKKLSEVKQQALTKAKRLADEEKRKIMSMGELEERKRLLDAKQKLIDKVFQEAQKLLQNMSNPDYEKLIKQMLIDNSVSGEEEIIMAKSDLSRLSHDCVNLVNQELIKKGKSGNLKLSAETRPMLGGFILRSSDMEINCTFDSIIKLQREELETEIAKILFGE
jgi:V/A-type H+-transporting ATPase subunit E